MNGGSEANQVTGEPRSLLGVIVRDVGADPAGAGFGLVVAGLLALAIVGLPLAILGVFVPLVVVPLVAAGWVGLVAVGWRHGFQSLVERGGRLASVTAVCAVAVFGLFAALNTGQHVLMDRDPGVYVMTAKWLSQEGTLIFDTGLPDEVLQAAGGAEAWVTQGVYPRADGTGYFQFTHLLALVLAVGGWLGDGVMLRIPALIAAVACLGVFVLARRLAGRWFAMIALGAVLLHPVTLHFAKDAYSEFLAVAFLMAGLTLWLGTEVTSRRLAVLAGMCLGGVTLARIDGWLTVLAFLLGLAYYLTLQRPNLRGRVEVPLLMGMFGVGALGMIDLSLRSPVYLSHLGSEVYPLVGAAIVASAIVVAAAWLGPKWRLDRFNRRLLATAAGVVVGGLGLYGLFVRPLVTVDRDAAHVGDITSLQAREGLVVDRLRTYAEDTLRWFTRYEGYLLVMLVIAAVVMATVVIVKSADRLAPILSTLLGVGFVYLRLPSITPDHFWAMRRFLPVVLPLGFVLLAWASARWFRASRLRALVSVAVVIPLAVGAVTMIAVGAPVAQARTQVGLLDATHDVCAALPPDAVAVMNDDLGSLFMVAIRTWCGVPTFRADDRTALDAARLAGFVPVAVTEPGRCLGGAEIAHIERVYGVTERTILQTPDEEESAVFAVSVKALDPVADPTFVMPPEALAGFEVAITTDGQLKDSIVATLGTTDSGLRLRLARDGSVEIVVDTTAGRLGTVVSFWSIADGRTRVLGGYLTEDTLYAVCDGQVMAATTLPGAVLEIGDQLTIRPDAAPESGFDTYEGDVRLVSP